MPVMLRSAIVALAVVGTALMMLFLARPAAAVPACAARCPSISVGVTGRHDIPAAEPSTARQDRRLITLGGAHAGVNPASGGTGSESPAYIKVAIIGLGALGVVLLVGSGLLVLAGRRRQVSA